MIKHKHVHHVKQQPIDKIIYFFALSAPLFELPQLYAIIINHSAKEVSLVTWGYFAISSFAWLIYAFSHKLRALAVSYLLFTIIEILVVIGILRYS